jgi:signal transduction histidine kinase
MVLAYVLIAAPVMRSDERTWRNGSYLVIAYVLFALLVWIDPATLILLFALYPQTFAALDVRSAAFATVTLTVAVTLVLIAQDGFSAQAVQERGLMGLLNLGFALVVGLFVTGVVRQSEQRGRLLRELHEARAELADAERQRGALAERERLAQEIHDTLAQGFTSIVMLSQAADVALSAGDLAAARERIALVQSTARSNLGEARSLVRALGPSGLREAGLEQSLRRLVEAYAAETGAASSFTVDGPARPLAPDADVVLVRATQEALANARKHADASRLEVRLRYDEDGALLTVTDDGRGFAPAAVEAGFGMSGMRARAEQVGGLADVTSTPGAGTTVKVRVP